MIRSCFLGCFFWFFLHTICTEVPLDQNLSCGKNVVSRCFRSVTSAIESFIIYSFGVSFIHCQGIINAMIEFIILHLDTGLHLSTHNPITFPLSRISLQLPYMDTQA